MILPMTAISPCSGTQCEGSQLAFARALDTTFEELSRFTSDWRLGTDGFRRASEPLSQLDSASFVSYSTSASVLN